MVLGMFDQSRLAVFFSTKQLSSAQSKVFSWVSVTAAEQLRRFEWFVQ